MMTLTQSKPQCVLLVVAFLATFGCRPSLPVPVVPEQPSRVVSPKAIMEDPAAGLLVKALLVKSASELLNAFPSAQELRRGTEMARRYRRPKPVPVRAAEAHGLAIRKTYASTAGRFQADVYEMAAEVCFGQAIRRMRDDLNVQFAIVIAHGESIGFVWEKAYPVDISSARDYLGQFSASPPGKHPFRWDAPLFRLTVTDGEMSLALYYRATGWTGIEAVFPDRTSDADKSQLRELRDARRGQKRIEQFARDHASPLVQHRMSRLEVIEYLGLPFKQDVDAKQWVYGLRATKQTLEVAFEGDIVASAVLTDGTPEGRR